MTLIYGTDGKIDEEHTFEYALWQEEHNPHPTIVKVEATKNEDGSYTIPL